MPLSFFALYASYLKMEIWEDIAANAEDGAKRLVAEYGDRLFSAAVRICGNDCDAEALVFRTLSHAIAKIGQYGKRSSFFSWLYSILANFHRMDMRKKGSTALVFCDELPEERDVALDGELLSGELPIKQRRILDGWMALHEEEAYAAWNLAVQGKQFEKIVAAM